MLDRTRSRLDIPVLRTIFGLKARPHHNHWTAVDRDYETLRIGMHALFEANGSSPRWSTQIGRPTCS